LDYTGLREGPEAIPNSAHFRIRKRKSYAFFGNEHLPCTWHQSVVEHFRIQNTTPAQPIEVVFALILEILSLQMEQIKNKMCHCNGEAQNEEEPQG